MITNPFEAKRPITTRPVLPTTSVKRQSSVAALRFGSDSATVTASLPEWTKKVKDPKITLADLENGSVATRAFKVIKFLKDLSANHDEYLPVQARKDLKSYHWTPRYWFTRIFKPSKARLMDTVYRGPIAIKLKQEQVSSLPALKDEVESLKKATKNLNFLHKLPIKIGIFWANRHIKKTEGYAPLLNRVPPLPYAKFEKQIQGLQKAYNDKNSDNPIETIDKEPIGTGSIGQAYQATTKNGQKVVLKLIKPGLTPQYLDEYLPLLYYKAMLMLGKNPQDKQKAVTAAEKSIHILKDEIQPEKEAENTRLMKEWAQKLDCKEFQIPDVLASTESGLITPFVGEKDVADLTDAEKVSLKIKLAPDLTKLLVLSPFKPLDLHEGNMRSGSTPFWIDHGRQINLNDTAHKSLMKLIVSTLKAPQQPSGQAIWDNALLQDDTRANLKELLQLNPTANAAMLTNLDKVEADIKEKQKNSKTPADVNYADIIKRSDFMELKVQLSKLLGQPPSADQKQNKSSLSTEEGSDLANYSKPSILNAWASCALTLPGFAETQLPHHDVNQYRRKSSGFLMPYVQDTEAKSESEPGTARFNRRPKLSEKQKSQLQSLASILTDGLLKQTESTKITDAEREQLTKNLQNALHNDLLPRYSE